MRTPDTRPGARGAIGSTSPDRDYRENSRASLNFQLHYGRRRVPCWQVAT